MGNYDSRVFAAGGLGSISGVVATAPAGANLGEERWHNGAKYRLFYNAGNSQISKGRCFVNSLTVGNGPYSVTVSTVTETVNKVMGAVVHATATTGTYFWGVVRGGPVSLLVSNVSVATQARLMVAADGNHTLTATLTAAIAINAGATATTDAVGGNFHVFYEDSSVGGAT